MHLRRGHLRQLENKVVWVMPAMVNADSARTWCEKITQYIQRHKAELSILYKPMIDDPKRGGLDDLEKTRTQQQLKEFIDQLKQKARAGTLECCAIRLHMKDGTNPIVVIGGTVEEQAAARANLEALEAAIKTQKAQCYSIIEEIFPDLPEEERLQILESPERMRIAFNSLSDAQRAKLSSLSQECFIKYIAHLEDLSASALLGSGAIGFLR